MAKAVFHKNQRVYVKPVGTWASVERLLPQWVKGVEEPVRIFYDVGLGREFAAQELCADGGESDVETADLDNWRLVRAKNKWRDADDCGDHPFPGTFPVVVTDAKQWGGWRVPGAEYDRDPVRIEFQARVIASGLRLLRLASELADFAQANAGDTPAELLEAAREAEAVRRYVYEEAALAQAAE